MDNQMLITEAQRVLREEGEQLLAMSSALSPDFSGILQQLIDSPGKVIVSGVGKSALVGQKIAATLSSTGTPAFFLHGGDALHGDLGVCTPGDIALLLSKSGQTEELLTLIPALRALPIPIISMTCNANSPLALQSDLHILIPIEKEACPNALAPTTSTTAMMAMGDAISACLQLAKGFSPQDFARVHPSGMLGRQLLLRVKELMRTPPSTVSPNTLLPDIIYAITQGRVGACAVVDEAHQVLGIITDGDLRRALQKGAITSDIKASSLMNANPITSLEHKLASEALVLMESKKISQLLILNTSHQLTGILHLHDLLHQGIQ
ncbi:MAG: KpsF/GutQ family sugar-phosphate isomerase [Sphingobacteriia bacterium]|nr:KpsF/GutQ family sugar-phosphate isomerase [Sphingobacteriia bacterium]